MEDTTLKVSNAGGGMTTFPVSSGTEIELHIPGLHYNRTLDNFVLYHGDRFSSSFVARYWKEPHKFMPERFLSDWPRDAFIPFSQGTSCALHSRIHKSRTPRRCPCLPGKTVRAIVV